MVQIQGETLRTWAFKSPAVEKVQVELGTEGRPLEATVEVWNAAGNTPFQARVYSEDGEIRPISAVLEIPRGPSTVAVRNIGQMEFPMAALVTEEFAAGPSGEHQDAAQYIQGGALKTYPLDPTVDAVEVLLTTGGMPMNARIRSSRARTPTSRSSSCTVRTEWTGLSSPRLRRHSPATSCASSTPAPWSTP